MQLTNKLVIDESTICNRSPASIYPFQLSKQFNPSAKQQVWVRSGVESGVVESVQEMWRRRSPTSPSSSFARCPSLLNVPTRLTLQRRTIQDRLEKIDSAGEERQKRKRGRARGQGEDGSTDRETPREQMERLRGPDKRENRESLA